ncbi:MAG: RluA family pseudouridine synthase [Pseudomonadota bacterium]
MRNRPVPHIDPEEADFVRGLVLHQDEALIAFDKPSGLPVQTRGNRGRCLENLLPAFARSNGKSPRLVHRLDTGTSGVVLVAQTKPAAAHLSKEFAERRVKKIYLALAGGSLPNGSAGRIDQALRSCKGERGQPPMAPSDAENAQTAVTGWRILARAGEVAVFELRPQTGRMHQLRAHLKYLGCPILGDPLYGPDKRPPGRLMLHAASLALRHPSGHDFDIAAPVPEAMGQAALEAGLAVGAIEA